MSLKLQNTRWEIIADTSKQVDMDAAAILNIGAAGTDFGTDGGLTLAANLTVSAGGITVTGNSTITGTLGGVTTLTATSLAGTLTTAAQPNVTSLGALTALNVSGVGTITSTSASALTVGANGATNPVLKVNANTASVATGLHITGAAAAGGLALAVISSGTDENLTVDAKGSGTISIGTVSTGALTLGRATGISGAATVTSNSASALTVGRLGATTPALQVDASAAIAVTGLKLTAAASGGGYALAVVSSAADEALTINAKGTGTIGIGSVSTGAVTITPATTVTGAITPTGGVAAGGGFSVSPRLVHTGGNPAAATTDGTNAATNTAGTVYLAECFVPANMSVTGVAVFNGTAVAGNGKVMLYNSAGNRVAISASTAMSGTTAYQLIPFTGGPIAVVGPATYFIGTIYDDTSHDLRGHTIGSFAAGEDAGNTYGTDSTFAAVTLPTTFATTTGPIASLY